MMKFDYNLYLDDFRFPMDSFNYTHDTDFSKLKWTIVRSYDEFVEYITKMHEVGHFPALVSFDHDLADEHYHTDMYKGSEKYNEHYAEFKEKTGYECAKWLVDFCIENKLNFPLYKVHSMNPIGKENINKYIENAKKRAGI
jgi:hypothetical protein